MVQFVKEQQEARYNEEMIPDLKESEEEGAMDDELYPEAVRLVVEARVASASMLQRRSAHRIHAGGPADRSHGKPGSGRPL